MIQEITLYNGLGFCNLVSIYGMESDIAKAARTSYLNHDEERSREQDQKLLEYLFKNRHTSPFEQVSMTMHLKIPIFVMRQLIRHRTAKLNESSARYAELSDEMYAPYGEWRAQAPSGQSKQSTVESKEINQEHCDRLARECFDYCFDTYKYLLGNGVGRELARIVMPVACMTEVAWQMDIHNLIHLLNLRLHPHAQKEIRDLAEAMFTHLEFAFPFVASLFRKYEFTLQERKA